MTCLASDTTGTVRDGICIALDTHANQKFGGLHTLVKPIGAFTRHLSGHKVSSCAQRGLIELRTIAISVDRSRPFSSAYRYPAKHSDLLL